MLALAMVGAAYAAVPLYKLFCQVTGYAGTTRRASAPPSASVVQTVRVRFDSNVNGLPWSFVPDQRILTVRLGQIVQASYTTRNLSSRTTTGTATFNVSPDVAGAYFNKLQCFCFTEQTLKPGQSVHMPVTLFVDPDMLKDSNAKSIPEITLSYTFYPAQTPADGGQDAAAETINPVAVRVSSR